MNAFSRLASLPGVATRMRKRYCITDARLCVSKFGLNFPNPVGLAAGFDKAGQWFNQLSNLGFGTIEIGTITGRAQPGNPKPRMFRLPDDKALINRMGFNSDGCDAIAHQLSRQTANKSADVILGINIGKSKVVKLLDAPAEHQKSFERLFPYSDYFTINVSSPNTPNLRELQNKDHLTRIIDAIHVSNERLSREQQSAPKPVLLKIAPDLSDSQLAEIAAVARAHSLSGIIATNTTVSRSNLKTDRQTIERIGAGGLSGKPLHHRSLEVVAKLYRLLHGEIPIVGVGGIMNGIDAWNMITAGADLVQLYTGFIYGGPAIVRDINLELIRQIETHKLNNISEAAGSNFTSYLDS